MIKEEKKVERLEGEKQDQKLMHRRRAESKVPS